MYITDSHIHLQDFKSQKTEEIIELAYKNNVKSFVNVSSNPNDWKEVISLSNKFSNITPAIGIHPWYSNNISEKHIQELEDLLQKHQNLWVGECGLDKIKNKDLSSQLNIFVSQIHLANKYNSPLIIHSVHANDETEKLFSILPTKTIFHSYTGSIEWGNKIQKAGFYLGINFSILKKKNSKDIISNLDINKILLETDGPYQSPEKNCESLPSNLPYLVKYIANCFRINEIDLTEIFYNNWIKFIKK